MEYEYWIVEADRLHNSVSKAIANSPYRQKFEEFKQVVERVESAFEEEMGSWEVNHSNGDSGGGSCIESGMSVPNEQRSHSTR